MLRHLKSRDLAGSNSEKELLEWAASVVGTTNLVTIQVKQKLSLSFARANVRASARSHTHFFD